MKFAFWWKRFAAYLIDAAIIYSIIYMIYKILYSTVVLKYFFYFSGLFAIFYFSLFLLFNKGQTIGGLFLRIKYVGEQGEKPTTLRTIGAGILSTVFLVPLGINIFFILFLIIDSLRIRNKSPYQEKRQTSLDVITKTSCVEV